MTIEEGLVTIQIPIGALKALYELFGREENFVQSIGPTLRDMAQNAAQRLENAVLVLERTKNLSEKDAMFHDPRYGRFTPLNSVNKKKAIDDAEFELQTAQFHANAAQKALQDWEGASA